MKTTHKQIPLHPTGDRIIISPDAVSHTTQSGIILAEAFPEQSQTGTVLATGPGRRDTTGSVVPMSVSVGDRVLCSQYSTIEYNGVEYGVLSEESILAIIKE